MRLCFILVLSGLAAGCTLYGRPAAPPVQVAAGEEAWDEESFAACPGDCRVRAAHRLCPSAPSIAPASVQARMMEFRTRSHFVASVRAACAPARPLAAARSVGAPLRLAQYAGPQRQPYRSPKTKSWRRDTSPAARRHTASRAAHCDGKKSGHRFWLPVARGGRAWFTCP